MKFTVRLSEILGASLHRPAMAGRLALGRRVAVAQAERRLVVWRAG